ncbi:plasma membrane-associated cation-binding protein 1 [Mercurialis annua]|uniref:plasma membrane-associated cation-binding protein 1 n=1 Tax=Mercurialis annua TaxID=3986 RepID=UPI00215DE14F|nr:plasma membrane-associated cation-binding protein 1 [Mercurialis annua]XP_050224773.1 plasma membrane-associated cation-binding protein 1 [Mercurialis annua]
MGYWKSKVLPTINKVFKKESTAKKAAAAEACKSFDESKEEINKVFEDNKTDLQPKVLEIYEASAVELKSLVKDPKDAGLKKHSALVQKFLDELATIEFPGSKTVSEASTKFGAAYVSAPIFFIFEKVSTFLPVEEEKPKEAAGEETTTTEKEIVVEKPAEAPVSVEATPAEPPAKAAEEAVVPPPPATKVEEAAEPPKA